MSTLTAPVRPAVTTDARPTGFWADTWNVMTRELKPVWREPASVLFAMVQPLVFLGLFAPLLPETNGSALQWFVPGIVAMTCLMGASFTGANLSDEMISGSHERMLVSPLSRSSLLVGRACKEVVPMLLQTMIILVVVTPFSFDLHLSGVVVAVAMLALFSIGVGSLSFALALVSEGQEWLFSVVQQTLIFPARRDPAPARRGATVAAGALGPQPADLRRRRDSGTLLRGLEPGRDRLRFRGRSDRRGVRHLDRRPGDASGLTHTATDTAQTDRDSSSAPLECRG